MKKLYKKNLTIIFVCLCFVAIFNFVYYFIAKADSGAAVQFTEDTIVSLSGISDGDLYIRTGSECASLNVLGSVLTVTGIPDGSDFILKTSSHNNGLKLTPSGGTLDLTLDSSHISSGNITQWTLDASSGVTVVYIIGGSQANTWYAIKSDSVLFNSYQSDDSGEITFTYDNSLSNKVFTIEIDQTSPAEFSLTSPTNNTNVSESKPTFTWNASTDPDLSHYQLYIDGSLDTNSITDTSVAPTNSLSCGDHTWYIRAVDKAGNYTDSSTFNLSITCGGGVSPAVSIPPTPPSASLENPQGSFQILINNGAGTTNIREVILKFEAGIDVKNMAVSENLDFKYANQELYQSTKTWMLSEGNGIKIVYVKFYTQYGVASEIINDSIILNTSQIEDPSLPKESIRTISEIINEAIVVIKSSPSVLTEKVGLKRSLPKEQAVVEKYVQPLTKGFHDLTLENQNSIVNFVAYGTPSTLRLGMGERAGVLNCFKDTFEKLPITQIDWEDVIKISNGRWPKQTILKKEAKAAKLFETIYLREPDRTNPHDDAAVVVITYGLRPINRNLDSERAAIKTFVHIFKKIPTTVTDWTVIKAIAYSGAKR